MTSYVCVCVCVRQTDSLLSLFLALLAIFFMSLVIASKSSCVSGNKERAWMTTFVEKRKMSRCRKTSWDLTLIWCGSRQDDRENLFDFRHILINFIDTVPDVLNLQQTHSRTSSIRSACGWQHWNVSPCAASIKHKGLFNLPYTIKIFQPNILPFFLNIFWFFATDLKEEFVHEGCIVHTNLHLVVILITRLTEQTQSK